MFLLVVLAMVAGFAALRLFMVLGKRTGHEQQPLPKSGPKAAEERTPLTVVQRPVEAAPETRELASRNIEAKAEAGIRAIIAADSAFDASRFLEGAQAAYRMILEAFWKADEEQLHWLVEDDVRESFAQAIEERNTAGHVLDNKLLSIERAVIADASLAGKVARITVRFDADIAAVTRDGEGVVVAGSMSDAVETHDVWTFTRTLRSADPNWKLSDTDEA